MVNVSPHGAPTALTCSAGAGHHCISDEPESGIRARQSGKNSIQTNAQDTKLGILDVVCTKSTSLAYLTALHILTVICFLSKSSKRYSSILLKLAHDPVHRENRNLNEVGSCRHMMWESTMELRDATGSDMWEKRQGRECASHNRWVGELNRAKKNYE